MAYHDISPNTKAIESSIALDTYQYTYQDQKDLSANTTRTCIQLIFFVKIISLIRNLSNSLSSPNTPQKLQNSFRNLFSSMPNI